MLFGAWHIWTVPAVSQPAAGAPEGAAAVAARWGSRHLLGFWCEETAAGSVSSFFCFCVWPPFEASAQLRALTAPDH